MRYAGAVAVLLMPLLSACGSGSPASPQPLAGFPAPAASDDTVADPLAAKGLVTLKGSIGGQLTSSSLIPNTQNWVNVIDATGNSPRIGKFTVTISFTRNGATGAEEGFYLFTTPKGTLTATFVGQTVASSGGVFTVDDTLTITDATGRFVGSTGGLQASRVYANTVGANVSGSVTGQVNLQ